MNLEELPVELLVGIFRFLDGADLISLRLTSVLLHRLSYDDVALWRPLFERAFPPPHPPYRRPPRRRRPSADEEDDRPRLVVPRDAVTELLIPRFHLFWEWAYKSKVLELVVLTQRGATCYAMPKVRFPPTRWVARHQEPRQGLWCYEGEWLDTKRDGWGSCRFLNGNLYCGQWRNDMMHGQGVMYYGDGSVYDGTWCRSARHGKGSFYRPGRGNYTGEWRDNKRCGWGTMQWSHSFVSWRSAPPAPSQFIVLQHLPSPGVVVFHGRWKRNRAVGEGTATLASGAVYHGLWRNKKRGTSLHREGTMFVGLLKIRHTTDTDAPS